MSGDCSLHEVLQEVGFGDRVDDVLSAPCLDSRCFLRMRMLRYKIFSIALCISVSEEACILRNGKILRVSGDCSLREVLQEVGFGDQVNDVLMQRANCACDQTLAPNKTLG